MRRRIYKFDLGSARSGIFLRGGLDRKIDNEGDLPVGQAPARRYALQMEGRLIWRSLQMRRRTITLPATTPDRTTFFMASKTFMASQAVRFSLMTPTALLAKTEKRKDYADHDNKTDQIDDSIHETPPVSVSDPPESNVLLNRKFRDSAQPPRSANPHQTTRRRQLAPAPSS
jgi:hypothetical protein